MNEEIDDDEFNILKINYNIPENEKYIDALKDYTPLIDDVIYEIIDYWLWYDYDIHHWNKIYIRNLNVYKLLYKYKIQIHPPHVKYMLSDIAMFHCYPLKTLKFFYYNETLLSEYCDGIMNWSKAIGNIIFTDKIDIIKFIHENKKNELDKWIDIPVKNCSFNNKVLNYLCDNGY